MRLGLLILCLVFSARAVADEPPRFSGGQLAAMCQSEANLDYGYCAGYVTGVADVLMMDGIGDYRACNHDNVRSQEYLDIFRTYVATHPDARNMSADLAVAAALARAFPCSR